MIFKCQEQLYIFVAIYVFPRLHFNVVRFYVVFFCANDVEEFQTKFRKQETEAQLNKEEYPEKTSCVLLL